MFFKQNSDTKFLRKIQIVIEKQMLHLQNFKTQIGQNHEVHNRQIHNRQQNLDSHLQQNSSRSLSERKDIQIVFEENPKFSQNQDKGFQIVQQNELSTITKDTAKFFPIDFVSYIGNLIQIQPSLINNFMTLKIALLICNFLILAFFIKVDTNNSLFVDEFARYRIYHGVNVVYKLQPFHPNLVQFSSNHSLTDQDLYNLKHWGMNVIRLHVAWEGLEPQKGVYNYTYVETIRQIMRKCNKFGINVLLDAHQDLFVRQFCGQGLPTWTAGRQSFPAPLDIQINYDQKGFPLREDCLKILFAKFYLTFDIMKLQKDLFTNQRNLLDHFCKFWQIIVQNLKDEPNLIGYEFINEPIGYDAYLDPAGTLLPGQGNNKYLLPAYKQLYNAIRKHDKQTPIYFEPSTVDLLGGGFHQTPGGPGELDRQVFSYHIYCPIVTDHGQPIYPLFCDYFNEKQTVLKQQNLRRLKIGGFLTQFGAVSNSQKSAHQITTITDQMQKHFRSWAYWQFKYYEDITTLAMPGTTEAFYDEQGNYQLNKIKALARPYAYAVCGNPLSETLREGIFSLTWVASDDCFGRKTELFLSQALYYPNGITISYSSNCRGCELRLLGEQTENFYEVEIGQSQGQQITVTISPK